MKHPPYHLKPHKAVDRFMLIELLRLLNCELCLSDYVYYGFGGPFLEDMKLINDFFPAIKLNSLEKNMETLKRQEFHKFSSELTLKEDTFSGFIGQHQGVDKEIYWLDYTDLKPGYFTDFASVLQTTGKCSIVKLTVRADRDSDFDERTYFPESEKKKDEQRKQSAINKFEQHYKNYLPSGALTETNFRPNNLVNLLVKMIEIASKNALPYGDAKTDIFNLLNASYYSDSVRMLSITGIKCSPSEFVPIKEIVSANPTFRDPTWNAPRKIDLPDLSVGERLKLNQLLPIRDSGSPGDILAKKLGYKVAKTEKDNKRILEAYSHYYNYYPLYGRISI